MPHSSGGGSHSGGGHSGGSFGGGSHGGSSGRGISKRYFPNAKRFRYYDRNGRERYVYGRELPTPMSKALLIFVMIFMLPFIFSGGMVWKAAGQVVIPPKPLKAVYASPGEHVKDEIGAIGSNRALETSMKSFETKTGICPYIITVYDSEWQGKYNSLEDYAYSLYVNNFADEQHFLLVYSEPEDADSLDFVDWSWEGMQGDETDPILTVESMEKFNSDIQKYLTIDSLSTGDAFEKAFSNANGYLMKAAGLGSEQGLFLLFFGIAWYGFIAFFIATTIRGYIVSNREYQEVSIGASAIPNVSNTYEDPYNNANY